MIKTIKKYIGYLRQVGMWNYKYLGMLCITKNGYDEESPFIKSLYEVGNEIADRHCLPVVRLPFDKLNKDETDEKKKATGKFVYRSTTAQVIKTEKKLSCFFVPKYETAIDEDGEVIIVPRILLTDRADVFVFIHELGHFNIYQNGGEQTEKDADLYFYEFLKTNFPPFFMWVFQTAINVMCGFKPKFTDWQAYNHYLNAKKYLEQWTKEKN